jgi:hypothetical protein
MRKAMKFNIFYLIFRYIRLFSPALIFLWFLIHSYPIVLSIALGVALVFWLGEVKVRSLRNISEYASQEFRRKYLMEISK